LLKKGGRRFFNEFPLDRKYAHRTMRFLAHRAFPFAVSGGRFVTVSTCTGTKRRALELVKRFGAICENMEGAAIAHVCKRYGIPMIEIRGISNVVEDRNKREWDIPLAAENCQRAALACIETLWDAAGGA
jgi:futalosine hydrolase